MKLMVAMIAIAFISWTGCASNKAPATPVDCAKEDKDACKRVQKERANESADPKSSKWE